MDWKSVHQEKVEKLSKIKMKIISELFNQSKQKFE